MSFKAAGFFNIYITSYMHYQMFISALPVKYFTKTIKKTQKQNKGHQNKIVNLKFPNYINHLSFSNYISI